VFVACLVAGSACARSPSVITDHDDVGAFTLDPNSSFGVDKTRLDDGATYSAGSILLCKKDQSERVMLRHIEPVSVVGQIRLDEIGVRMTHPGSKNSRGGNPDTQVIGTLPGVPNGLHDPGGFAVVTTCSSPRALVTEIVVTLTKTGSEGGALDGIRVDYRDGTELHELVIHFHFGLCGTGASTVPCAPHP